MVSEATEGAKRWGGSREGIREREGIRRLEGDGGKVLVDMGGVDGVRNGMGSVGGRWVGEWVSGLIMWV